jgi:hypothetical protein
MRLPFCIAISLGFITACSDQGGEPGGSLAALERSLAAARENGQLVGDVDLSAVSAPLVAILANPSSYQGQRVRTIGVIFVSPGESADSGEVFLFFSKEQMDHFIALSALSLTLSPPYSVEDLVRMHGKYVLIEGRVDADATGHMGVFAAGLIDINRVELIGDER